MWSLLEQIWRWFVSLVARRADTVPRLDDGLDPGTRRIRDAERGLEIARRLVSRGAQALDEQCRELETLYARRALYRQDAGALGRLDLYVLEAERSVQSCSRALAESEVSAERLARALEEAREERDALARRREDALVDQALQQQLAAVATGSADPDWLESCREVEELEAAVELERELCHAVR